jgi:hemerythrin-like metal-binding protein
MRLEQDMTTHQIAYSRTGIAEIDEQHGQLVSYLERLLTFIDQGYGVAATFDVLASLKAYTATHFEFEEQHMRERAYPKLAEHVDQHLAIIQRLAGLQDDLESGKDVEAPMTEALREWIVKHIDVEDMEYARFLGTDRG